MGNRHRDRHRGVRYLASVYAKRKSAHDSAGDSERLKYVTIQTPQQGTWRASRPHIGLGVVKHNKRHTRSKLAVETASTCAASAGVDRPQGGEPVGSSASRPLMVVAVPFLCRASPPRAAAAHRRSPVSSLNPRGSRRESGRYARGRQPRVDIGAALLRSMRSALGRSRRGMTEIR